MVILELVSNFAVYFWEVLTFWACWQFCDFALSKAKVKLRKPWKVEFVEVDNDMDGSYNASSRGKSVGSCDRDKEVRTEPHQVKLSEIKRTIDSGQLDHLAGEQENAV